MQLREATGHFKCVEIFCDMHRQVQIAKLPDGEWVALNNRSTDPKYLRSRDFRSAWALAQGLKVKDVENYVRRERKREEAEYKQDAVDGAVALLVDNGFTVVAP